MEQKFIIQTLLNDICQVSTIFDSKNYIKFLFNVSKLSKEEKTKLAEFELNIINNSQGIENYETLDELIINNTNIYKILKKLGEPNGRDIN